MNNHLADVVLAVDSAGTEVSSAVEALEAVAQENVSVLREILATLGVIETRVGAANEWLEDLHAKADEIKRELSYLDGSIGSYGCRIDELNLPTS